MAKHVNGRIYLERVDDGDTDNRIEEIIKASKMRQRPCVIIEDNSDLGKSAKIGDVYDLYLSVDKSDGDGNIVFDRKVCGELLSYIKRGQYLKLGCWATEKSLVEEALELEPVEVFQYEEVHQIDFLYEVNDKLMNCIVSSLMDKEGKVKWFNIILYDGEMEENVIFSASHYGCEYYIMRMTEEEVEGCISIVEKDFFSVRIDNGERESR